MSLALVAVRSVSKAAFGGQTLLLGPKNHSCGPEGGQWPLSTGIEGNAWQFLGLGPVRSYGDRFGVLGVSTTVVTEELASWTLSQCHCLHSEADSVPCVFTTASWSSEWQVGQTAVAICG